MTIGYQASIDAQHAVIVAIKGDPIATRSIQTVALDLAKFQGGRWALQLDAVFAHRRDPIVILAQGVACLAVAWWARLSPHSYVKAIQGALFLTPLSVGFGQDAIAAAARQGPSTRLPFPSVLAGMTSPFVGRSLALADEWGSRFVEIGADTANGPTNRNAVCTDDEARLTALLPLLQQPATAGSIAFDDGIAATPAADEREM